MRFARRPNAEPLPGYRLIEFLGKGGFGEVWKCEAPGGLVKAIKLVPGNLSAIDTDCAPAEQELTALQHLKSVRHPFLLSIERIERIDGDLVIVMELADRNLHDVLLEHQATGLPGVPRAELLGYLAEAAEALDVMSIRHGLQHLDIKPRNLFLTNDHVKVGDFGLVNRLDAASSGSPAACRLGGITPFYAAPEVLEGVISPQSDQYSLAVVYQELLTGSRPFDGKNLRQLVLQHVSGQPDLRMLPAADRPVVARALSKDWHQRFPSCRDFLRALIRASVAAAPAVPCQGRTNLPERLPGETRPAEPPSSPDAAPTSCASLAGYQFLTCLRRGSLSELWKVTAGDGRERLARFIHGCTFPDPRSGAESVLKLKSLEHPALPRVEVVRGDADRLVLVTDRFDKTLREHQGECRRRGLPGIPRWELLSYLQTGAEALDFLYQRHSLQHLGLNPCELVLVNGKLRVEGCGLVQLLWLPAGQPVAQLNARYAAPELFLGRLSRSCDQYSLASIYQEMLIGLHPYHGQDRRRPGEQRKSPGRPDLDLLPALDRPIVARALHADPTQRFSTCTELVRALEGASIEGTSGATSPVARLPAISASPPRLPLQAEDPNRLPSPSQVIAELVKSTADSLPIDEPSDPRCLSPSGEVLERRCSAWLPADVARLKLDGFCQQWKAKVIHDDDELFVFRVSMAPGFWQQCVGWQPILEVEVRLTPPQELAAKLTEVSVQVRSFGCGRELGDPLVSQVGPLLLDSLSAYLQVNWEHGVPARLSYPHAAPVAAPMMEGCYDALSSGPCFTAARTRHGLWNEKTGHGIR